MGCQYVIDPRWTFGDGAMMRRPASGTERAAVPERTPTIDSAAESKRARLEALVRRMALREEPALAEFYDATLGSAYGLTKRIVRNAALAEEVVGDAYFQAWRSAGRYDEARSGPLTWLLMICRSRALDALRARDVAIVHEAPETLKAEADQQAGDNPLDLLAAVESRSAVHGALRALSATQRQMIGLAFFRGLSHQEIAEHTKVPLGTVKSQIRRALEALRKVLEV